MINHIKIPLVWNLCSNQVIVYIFICILLMMIIIILLIIDFFVQQIHYQN